MPNITYTTRQNLFRSKNIQLFVLALSVFTVLLTQQVHQVYASVDEQGAYDEGYDLGYNDYLNGIYGEDVYCDSYNADQDIWCEAYINGYEDGQQDAEQGE